MSEWTYHGGGVLSKPRADGRLVYFVKYRWRGEPVFERVGLTEAAARRRVEARRDQRTDPAWVPPPIKERREAERAAAAKAERAKAAAPVPTFADLIKVYRTECLKAKRRKDWQGWMLTLAEAEFGVVELSMMTPERIEAWRDRLTAEKKTASTTRKYVYFVSGIYADTMQTAAGRRLVQDNPCRLVLLPAEAAGLRKALTAEQAGALLVAAREDPALYRWARLVLSTGMRVEEAEALEWGHAELEWERGTLKAARFAVHETKTGGRGTWRRPSSCSKTLRHGTRLTGRPQATR